MPSDFKTKGPLSHNMKLYTTNCPKCKMLKMRLDSLGCDYETCEDVSEMEKLGFMEAPILESDGTYMNFVDAVMWLNKMGGVD